MQDYQFVVGKTFTFYESEDSHNYFHRCQFLEIVPHLTIAYSWEHPSHSNGISKVVWQLEAQEAKTWVTLTHSGVESFADAGEEFARHNFEIGWKGIVSINLRNYLYGIERLVFNIAIETSPPKLWHRLWEKENYTRWTQPFCEGSYLDGDLEQGNRVHFLTPSGEGMYSDIIFLKENEFIYFSHIGMVRDFKELPLDAETERWSGCIESYNITTEGSTSKLKVEVDAIAEYADYMKKTFPLALQKLKELSEND